MTVISESPLNAHRSGLELKPSLIPLKITINSVDLDLDLTLIENKQQRDGKIYEETCFDQIVAELKTGEVAYGAHLLNKLNGLFNSPNEQQRISIPDALVGEINNSPEIKNRFNLSPEEPVIRIIRIIEARTGDINGIYKLKRFSNLTAELRRDPYLFTEAIKAILGERGGILIPQLIVAPPDEEIEIDFYSPHEHTDNDLEFARSQYNNHRFKKIGFRTVPLTIYNSSTQTS
jgi:hypothetical protein